MVYEEWTNSPDAFPNEKLQNPRKAAGRAHIPDEQLILEIENPELSPDGGQLMISDRPLKKGIHLKSAPESWISQKIQQFKLLHPEWFK